MKVVAAKSFVIVLLVLILAPALHVASAQTPVPAEVPIPGAVPAVVNSGTAHLSGPHPASDSISLSIGLALSNPSALDAFMADAADPQNPQYHHFLTLDQANAMFNPTAAQEGQVISWVERYGLTVTRTYPNHLLVDVEGTFAQVETMLNVAINDYTTTQDGGTRTF